jgi:hypothetical protein
MRVFTHEVKNKLAERINNEVDQKHRKLKQDRLDKESAEAKKKEAPKPELINTSSQEVPEDQPAQEEEKKEFFTQDEKDAITKEQDDLFWVELDQLYDQMVQKATYLIKLQPPHESTKSTMRQNSTKEKSSELLKSWRLMQQDKGSLKTVSSHRKEVMQEFASEVVAIL